MILIEGIAGSGKSTLRNRVLADTASRGVAITHLGQFSWLSLDATRAIVRLRQGSRELPEGAAIAAVCLDLSLHVRHNIREGVSTGELVVDRLVLSTAALLAAIYGGSTGRFVERLNDALSIKPTLTVVLTTPPDVCWKRLEFRHSAARFVESWEMLQKLSALTQEAAEAWEHLTGSAVIFRSSTLEADIVLIANEIAAAMAATPKP